MRIAIDLGSLVTKIFKAGSGVVLSEPSVVAIESGSNQIKAIGADAKRLIGKTADNTVIINPIFEGEIVNEALAIQMLTYFLKKVDCYKKNVYAQVGVPCGIDGVMIDGYRKVMHSCQIKRVDFIPSPMLSALGQNVALNDFSPCFAINIGGGVTNIAAFSLDGIIAAISLNLGGSNIDAHIIDYIAERNSLKIGLLTAERVKINAGSLLKDDLTGILVNGRDIISGKPRSLNVTAEALFEPISIYIDKIIEYAADLLAKLPAEVCAEIRHTGCYLSGGSANFAGAENYFAKKLGMAVHMPDQPELAAIIGAGYTLSNQAICDKIKIRFANS